MANPWFKFYGGEYLSDPKILQLTAEERSGWVTLLCLASQTEGGEIKFLSERQLWVMAGISKPTKLLKKLADLDMVSVDSNGTVTVRNWMKRQYSESLERVRKFREKRSGNADVTDRIEESRVEEKRIDKNRVERVERTPRDEAMEFFDPSSDLAGDILKEFSEKGMPQDILAREAKKFMLYWTEKNKSGTRQKWEMEKTFEVRRRLVSWFSRVREFSQAKETKGIRI